MRVFQFVLIQTNLKRIVAHNLRVEFHLMQINHNTNLLYIRKFLFLLCSCFSVVALSGWVINQSLYTWYVNLNKPEWLPTHSLFIIVWGVIYTLMAISGFLIWKVKYDNRHFMYIRTTSAAILFWVQLIINAAWSILFFGLHNPFLGLIDAALLFILVLLMVLEFRGISIVATLLLLPYLAWVGFATYMNYLIWQLN